MEEKENFTPPPSPQAPPLVASSRFSTVDTAPITGPNDFYREFVLESKKLWFLAGPGIFSIVSKYSLGALTQIFAGHIGTIELTKLWVSSSGAVTTVAPDAVSGGHGNTTPHDASVALCAAAIHAFPSSLVRVATCPALATSERVQRREQNRLDPGSVNRNKQTSLRGYGCGYSSCHECGTHPLMKGKKGTMRYTKQCVVVEGVTPKTEILQFTHRPNSNDYLLSAAAIAPPARKQSQSTEHSAAVGRVSSSGAAAAVAPDAVSSGHGNTAPHAASVTLCAAAAVHAFPSSSVHAFPSSSVRAAAHVPHQQHQNGSSGQQDFLYQD
ncbi:hypothetical protein LR48_Vigan03g265300 [Vigna angularis]|uniref:Uncharacterized protein n=1 Tax=Phaseolus angularis TaxID=3914 RepID=A0A0L9U978_PHAAN|nr:hypothetical protein LR48_Vigan03g265300 [Vigna angularis]